MKQKADLRIGFAPEASADYMEGLQNRLTKGSLAANSVLQFPNRVLFLTFKEGQLESSAKRIRSLLVDDASVQSVDACPCEQTPPTIPTEFGTQKLVTSCAQSQERSARGCLTEFIKVQAKPGKSSTGADISFNALLFVGSAAPFRGHQVEELNARVSLGGSAYIFWADPLSDTKVGRSGKVPLHIGGFEDLDHEGTYSPGRLRPFAMERQSYRVSSLPLPSVSTAQVTTRIEGALSVAAPISEKFTKDYTVKVEYSQKP